MFHFWTFVEGEMNDMHCRSKNEDAVPPKLQLAAPIRAFRQCHFAYTHRVGGELTNI